MWPEASRLVHFCCSHQVAHFLSSSVISVISCSLSMPPCVSAVVSVHCNIIKWWHKLVFPFLLFSRLRLKPCFTLQGSNSQNMSARRVLGHFGTSICGHTIEMLELGARFVSAAANIPAHLPMLWRENLRRRARRKDNNADCCSVFLPFPNNAQPPVVGGGSAGPGWRRRWSYSLLPPVRQTWIQSSTSRDVAYCSCNPQENIHHLIRNTSRLFQELIQAQGGYSTPDTCDLGITAMIAPCGRIRGSGELTHVVVETDNSIVKTEPSDLICYSVSVGLLLTSFHSACN